MRRSVDQTHTVTEQINKQIVGPLTSTNTALQLMSQTKEILNEEKKVIHDVPINVKAGINRDNIWANISR